MTTRTFKITDAAVALVFSEHKWGNRKKANKEAVETPTDKKMLNLTKKLIDSIEYKAVVSFLTSVKAWVTTRSVPSFFRDGVYFFDVSLVEEVEEYLTVKMLELKPLVDALVDAYPERIKEAEAMLSKGQQFNVNDYPSSEQLRSTFYFEWQWISFGVPKELPAEVYAIEKDRLARSMSDAAEKITMTLRGGFKKLLDHAVDVLTPVNGKKKTYRDSTIDNITDFISTFAKRNLTNDTDLQELIKKTETVLLDVDDAKTLRDDPKMAKYVAKQFESITKTLDEIIVVKPVRKFNFDEE